MSTLFGDARQDLSAPLTGAADLEEVFLRGEKPTGRFGIGIEYERLPVHRLTGQAVPYAASSGPSIEAFLAALEHRGWKAELDRTRIIALEKAGTRVTLEPGAQVELSGRVHTDLAQAAREVAAFHREADDLAASMGFVFLGVGHQPFTTPGTIPWVPKSRYQIMAPYLERRGHLAHHMMKATAGCQINLDYSSQDEAMEMLRTAMGITSVVTALCANSPLSCGQLNGFLSKRSHVWTHTDPDRCGLLRLAFEPSAGYADYTRYALDVPMLFVVRAGTWIDMTGHTFRQYLETGASGLTPTVQDWLLHLTTLFPEVRLKSYLEVRGSDSGPPEMVLAQAALWKGLLYDTATRRLAWRLVEQPSFEQRVRFHHDVSRWGLAARLAGTPALELARDLVGMAGSSLPPHEAAMLEPLRRIAREGITPADRMREAWVGPWRRAPERLVEELCAAGAALAR